MDIQLDWQGPFVFGKSTEKELPPNKPGVYIYAVDTPHGRLLAYVGKAIDIRSRWRQHVNLQLGGEYRVYDTEALRLGNLDEKYKCTTDVSVLVSFAEIASIAHANLTSYEWFWAAMSGSDNLLCAVESAIYTAIDSQRGQVAANLLQNDRPSRLSCSVVKVRCVSKWPSGIQIVGLPDVLEYGDREPTEDVVPPSGVPR